MNENKRTLEPYETQVQEYIDRTPQEVTSGVKNWIDKVLDKLPRNASIFEVGSAFGRDAKYIESLGYTVQRTDATHGFVKLLHTKGYTARDFNLITDEFDKPYDVIFADAVLLHFTRDEMELALQKVHTALAPKGRFAFSLIKGSGEKWSQNDKFKTPRFFCYWTESQITNALKQAGFRDISMTVNTFGDDGTEWLQVVAIR